MCIRDSGYIGSLIFYKTKIPDVIWLLLFGLIVGPLLSLVNTSMYISISPLLAAAAIAIILFDAGLNMDFYQTIKNFSRSMIFSVLGVTFSMVSVGLLAWTVFGFDLITGLLIGVILGGTSFPIVDAIVKSVKVRESVGSILRIESIITDPLVIVIAIALMNVIVPPSGGSEFSAVQSLLSAFSVGAFVGIFAGFAWLYMLRILKGKPFDYMLTLGIIFILYVFVESNGGSGAIASLVFGLVLGNGNTFAKILKIKKRLEFDVSMKNFQAEVTFLMRSFFFVLLGIVVVIKPEYIVYGLITSLALIIIRLVVVFIGTKNMSLDRVEKNLMRITIPKGLAAAVMAQYPLTYGIPGAEMISSIVFVVLLTTVIYATVSSKMISIIESKNPKIETKKSGGKNKDKEVVSFVKVKK